MNVCGGISDLTMFVSCLSSVSALTLVSLQLCAGSGSRCPHFALQAEEQQRPHVAGGRHTRCIWQKGDLLLLEEMYYLLFLRSHLYREDTSNLI